MAIERNNTFNNRFLAFQTPDLTRMLVCNTRLTPESLASVYPGFRAYRQVDDGLLYLKEPSEPIQKHPKIILQITGGSAAGKNTVIDLLRERLSSHHVGHTTILTATTRHQRPDEPDDAHAWLKRNVFIEQRKKHKFIEAIHQGSQWYGTRIEELERALESASQIVFWEAEIYGHPFMREYMEERQKSGKPPTPIVSIYLLNGESIRDYAKRIWKYRGHEFWWRFPKSMAEIKRAVGDVDGFLMNRPTDDPQLTEVIDTLMGYLDERVEGM